MRKRDANYNVIAKLCLQVIWFWMKDWQSVKIFKVNLRYIKIFKILKVAKFISFLPGLFKARLQNPFQKQKTEPDNLQNARSLPALERAFGLPRG